MTVKELIKELETCKPDAVVSLRWLFIPLWTTLFFVYLLIWYIQMSCTISAFKIIGILF